MQFEFVAIKMSSDIDVATNAAVVVLIKELEITAKIKRTTVWMK